MPMSTPEILVPTVPSSFNEKDEPPEPVIPDGAVYLIGGFVLCLVVGSLFFMAYVMISESAAVGGTRK